MGKIVVIANCHCLPIARTLALGLGGYTSEFIDVNLLDRAPFPARVADLQSRSASFVFSFPLSDKWKDLDENVLREAYGERLVTFTNVHFSGLHPDITYLGAMGARAQGFLTDYHSKLVLYAYATGRSAQDCRAMFDGAHYEKIGFFTAFEHAAAELFRRDENCDVRFGQRFLERAKLSLSLYTINHPTDGVLQDLCAALCQHVGLQFNSYPSEYLTNSLSDNVIWPIYQPIAEYHNLPYVTPQTFLKRNVLLEGRTLSLEEVISGFYAVYDGLPREEFAAQVAALPFFPTLREHFG